MNAVPTNFPLGTVVKSSTAVDPTGVSGLIPAVPTLGRASIAYQATLTDYVFHQACNVLPMAQQTGIVPIINTKEWFAERGEAREAYEDHSFYGFSTGKLTVTAQQYSSGAMIDEQDYANAAPEQWIDIEEDHARFTVDGLVTAMELDFRDTFMPATGTNPFMEYTIANAWTLANASTAKPFQDQAVNRKKFKYRKPNFMIIGADVWENLFFIDEVIDYINGGATPTNPAFPTESLLAQGFQVQDIYVARGVYNAANINQDEDPEYIIDNQVFTGYKTPSRVIGRASPNAMAAGLWTGLTNAGNNESMRTRRWENPMQPGGRLLLTDTARVNFVMVKALGALAQDATS